MKRCTAPTMLLLTALLLAACSEASHGSGTEDTASLSDDTTGTVTEAASGDERAPYTDIAPEVCDFGGYTYRIFANDNTDSGIKQYYSSEETGDLVNDAVFRRNSAVCDRYNINIAPVVGFTHENDRATAMKLLQAGDDFADVTALLLIQDSMKLAQEGALLDWNDYPVLRTDAPWWDARITDLEVYGKQYVVTGCIATADDMRQMVVTYNKSIWSEMDYEDPYNMVTEGRWTLDRMYALAKDVSHDLNGDGEMTAADRWGIVSESKAAWYLYLGSGKTSIHYENGQYLSNLADETGFDILNRVIEIMSDTATVCVMNDGRHERELTTADIWTEASKIFEESRTLFRTETFNGTERLRNMGQDYGVLPIPKWTEEQDAYYCMTNDDIGMLSLPTTVSDPERTALITEALAYESMFELQPTFYEVYLSEKLLRDEQSRAMMDLTLASKFYDMDYCFGALTGMSSAMESMAKTKKNQLASKAASLEKNAQSKIDKFLSALSD